MQEFIDRKQTYTSSKCVAPINFQPTFSDRGKSYQNNSTKVAVNQIARLFDHSISNQDEWINGKASEVATIMGFEHHQVVLSCSVET